ncbi:L-selectin-like isoform X1 [Polyodon spathula]|uniref:L-selectin-like isoform X1 n=1 Tax=Polyodon spathula TaxID=7913 RepID=UPI001B7D9343|nr:L-selectin-like isoform X1 [Polyodon spathula]
MKFQNEKPEFQQRNTIWILILISYEFTMLGCAEGWTYHKAARQMPWENARQWCQNHYTDMVAIQNKKEIAYLNEVFPMVKGYYWIGIRKLNGNWVWIATNKTLSQEAENWATGEPNNGKRGEDCVEMYIQRDNDTGKWNDEPCRKPKTALCFKAQCNQSTCSGHGECTETINNYTCNCEKGFDGKHCQDVVKCEALSEPDDRILTCSGLYGNFSYNSTCQFHCSEGFALNGSSMVTCNSSGDWTEPIPMCTAVKFEEPSKEGQIIINPDKFANVSFNSTCKFQCLEVQNDHLDYRHLTMAVVGASILATSLIIFFLLSRMRKKKHLHARLPGMEPPEVAQSNL